MTPQALPWDEPEPPKGYRERVAAYFRARPGRWIDGRELATVGGAYAWRSRIADCRVQLGMVIENRQRKVDGYTISEYRLVLE